MLIEIAMQLVKFQIKIKYNLTNNQNISNKITLLKNIQTYYIKRNQHSKAS